MMKSILILATVLSLCSALTLNETCGVIEIDETALFNICPLDTQSADVSDYDFYFDFTNPSLSCPGSGPLYAKANDSLTSCYGLAGSADPTVSALDSSDEGAGLVFTYAPANFTNGGNSPLQLIVQLSCDSNAPATNSTLIATMNSTTVLVTGASSSACPYVSLNMLTNFMKEYKYIFVAVFVILGVFICFFGFQTLKITIFIIATIAGVIISGLIFFHFTELDTPRWALWVIFVACIVVGLILGYVAVRFEAVGFVALGLVLGGVGGLFLFNLVLAPFVEGKKYVLYLVCSILAIIGGIIAYKTWKKVVIIATAVIGSYLIVRALSTIIGGFPSEESIASGVAHFSGVTYAYLVVIVILAILGAYVQWRRQKNSGEEEDQNAYERMIGGGNNGAYGNY